MKIVLVAPLTTFDVEKQYKGLLYNMKAKCADRR